MPSGDPLATIIENNLQMVDDKEFMILKEGIHTHYSISYNTSEALDIAVTNVDTFPRCTWSELDHVGRERWKEMCSKIDARFFDSKLWELIESINMEQDQFEICNSVRDADGQAFLDD
ncbi:hypothetical protein TNCV_2826001 [Trichonephila clavipes]|nr:hypothetical protein TNCV_2826001 [Trichonephila clavipes]